MNKLVVLLGMAGAIGCSASDDASEESTPIGKWAAQLNAACITAFVIEENGVYEGDIICELQSGSYGMQAEVGDYTISGSQISMTPTHASCPTADHSPGTANFEVTGDTLRLAFPSGALIMERIEGTPTGNAVVAFGCIDTQTGQFTQHDIEPI